MVHRKGVLMLGRKIQLTVESTPSFNRLERVKDEGH